MRAGEAERPVLGHRLPYRLRRPGPGDGEARPKAEDLKAKAQQQPGEKHENLFGSSLRAGPGPGRRMRSDPTLMDTTNFDLRGDHITLDALLKACSLAPSGGAAKTLIADGGVRVNGEIETRRGRKLRAGDEVALGAARIRLRAG